MNQAELEKIIENLPFHVQVGLLDIFHQAESQADFVNRFMVGNCPQCDLSKTIDCENIKGIEDICIGFCFDCGYLWCLECGRQYTGKPCACLDEMELEDE